MTLHWWMHWFWITAVASLSACALTSAYPTPIDIPRTYSQTIAPDEEILYSAERSPTPERVAKALYFDKAASQTTVLLPRPTVTADSSTRQPIIVHAIEEVGLIDENKESQKGVKENKTHSKSKLSESTLKEGQLKSNSSKIEESVPIKMLSKKETEKNPEEVMVVSESEPSNKTVNIPLRRFSNDSQLDTVQNQKNTVPQTLQVIDEDEKDKEIATEKPLSLETTILASQQSKSSLTAREPVSPLEEPAPEPTLKAGAIAGMALGAVAMSTLVAATSFVLYRRRYLNKPQTLNDKCSNPDSSAYIDDSTIRENSEEMYSLDNDSFLNSLEAMTIQNYWTDNVKHTKL